MSDRHGEPAEGIVVVAEDEHVDLIAIGSRELKREKEYPPGTITVLVSVVSTDCEVSTKR